MHLLWVYPVLQRHKLSSTTVSETDILFVIIGWYKFVILFNAQPYSCGSDNMGEGICAGLPR